MDENAPKKPLVIHSNANRDKTRPHQTQVVDWKQYLATKSEKGLMYFLGLLFGIAGALLILMSALAFLATFIGLLLGEGIYLPGLIIILICGGLGAVGLYGANVFQSAGNEVDQVELITTKNTHFLPMRTTLVRASEQPGTAQHDELLRAVTPEPATPPEELLRPMAD